MRQILIELPDDVVVQAERAARNSHIPLETYLVRKMGAVDKDQAVAKEIDYWDSMDLSHLPDSALTALIRTPVSATVSDRVNDLQDAQSERKLSGDERSELDRLMRVIHNSTMLKAIALRAWKTRHGALPDRIEADW